MFKLLLVLVVAQVAVFANAQQESSPVGFASLNGGTTGKQQLQLTLQQIYL